MSQQFQVLRCFSCRTFQGQQTKKAKKWQCKVCGEKQSYLKVYGQGSGKETRLHVQKLNSFAGDAEAVAQKENDWQREVDGDDDDYENAGQALNGEVHALHVTTGGDCSGVKRKNKWLKYLDDENNKNDEDNALDVSKRTKTKDNTSSSDDATFSKRTKSIAEGSEEKNLSNFVSFSINHQTNFSAGERTLQKIFPETNETDFDDLLSDF